MSDRTNTAGEGQAHEFRPISDLQFHLCGVKIRGEYCALPSVDPIHRPASDTPDDRWRERYYGATPSTDRVTTPTTTLTSDTRDTPPERIWLWPKFAGFQPEWHAAPIAHGVNGNPVGVSYTRTFTTTAEEAVKYLESINAPVTEDRILWAKFLATKPSVEQVNLASSLVLEDRKRHGEGLAEALREMVNSAIDFDDPRISYVSMQVDRNALAAARAAIAKHEGK